MIGNLPTDFGVSGAFHFLFTANTCQMHHVTSRPSPLSLVAMALVGDTGLRLCTKFEVSRPFRSEDMTHFQPQY